MKCYIKIYNGCKYDEASEKIAEYEIDGIENFKVVVGKENINCEVATPDPLGEYLILYFNDGTTTTYQNSLVDLFRY